MDIKEYLRAGKCLIDTFLSDYFSGEIRPAVLSAAMNYSLQAGGKRIRPILCLAACEACGRNSADIVSFASALEMVHTYSLIHDDLPAMDNDDLRRGKPTNHKIYGEAIAILAGDALLTEAFSIFAATVPGVHAESQMAAVRELAAASGMKGMVAGQVQDMLSENAEPDEETLRFIHRHKTAALLSASVRIGALLAGARSGVFESLSLYGDRIGLAFQVIDDILDIVGETEVIGKPQGSDERKKKLTYPRLYGIEKSRAIAGGLIEEALQSLGYFGPEADPLRGIASYLLSRTH
ncbi:MAG: polyprenyl synthetase [Thermodesulfovibrio sp.]|nr:polyprenyl synthetase [Thermodesulfovibrio sp.]